VCWPYFFCLCCRIITCSNSTYVLEYCIHETVVPISFSFLFDKFSVLFTCVVILISINVFLFTCFYIRNEKNFERFMWVLIGFVFSMCLLIFGGSYISLLVGWDGLGITSFFLIIFYHSSKSVLAGFVTLLINRLGDILIMLGLFFLLLGGSLGRVSPIILGGSFSLITGYAALTKRAQYPFRVWLPAAMAAPTPVSALVHSSTLVTAGIYLVFRLNHGTTIRSSLGSILLFCGAITCFLGRGAALFENDLKKIIALSTLSQLGVIVFSLGLGIWYISLFHLFTHAIFKAILFLLGGLLIIIGFGNQDIRKMGSLLKNNRLLTVFFLYSLLSLGGLPFIRAYTSKHIILEAMFSQNLNFLSCFIFFFGCLLTVSYRVRLIHQILISALKRDTPLTHTLGIWSILPLLLLAFLTLSGGALARDISETLRRGFLPGDIYLTMLFLPGMGLGFYCFFLLNIKKNIIIFYSLFFRGHITDSISKLFSRCVNRVRGFDKGWFEPNRVNFKQWFRFSVFLYEKTGWLYTSSYHFFRPVAFMFFFVILIYYRYY